MLSNCNFHFIEELLIKKNKSYCNRINKVVTISNRINVALIPCLDEYVDNGIDLSELWYSIEEEERAKEEVILEVTTLVELNPNLTTNLAMTFLYQPNMENIFLDIHAFKKVIKMNKLLV